MLAAPILMIVAFSDVVCVLCSWVCSDSIVLHINLIIYLRTKYNISKQNVSNHICVHVSIETEAFINNNPLEWWKYAVRLAFGRCSNFIGRKRERKSVRDRKEHCTKILNRHHFVVLQIDGIFFIQFLFTLQEANLPWYEQVWKTHTRSKKNKKKEENSNT